MENEKVQKSHWLIEAEWRIQAAFLYVSYIKSLRQSDAYMRQ